MSEKISTIIITSNARLRELLSLYLQEFSSYEVLDNCEGISQVYNTVSTLPKSLLFVDMSEDFTQIISKIAADCPNCKITAIKENPDVNFIIKTMRLGAKEILAYPIIKTDFLDFMQRMQLQFSDNYQKQNKCKMITVFSNKGGIGKTSIAANLALELAQITREDTVLVDLNFQSGDITTFMDLQPAFNISYMLQNLTTLNKDFLLSTAETYKDTSLHVLADPPYFKESRNILPSQISRFFEILKQSFSYIIVDTESNFDAKTITTLDYSDMILLATIVNLPALRNCQRCLELFKKLGYEDEKVRILVNRYMENDDITIDEVEKLLKKDIYWKIPNNYFALMASINKGMLLSELNRSSNVAQSYRELAMHVSNSVFRNSLIKKFSGDGAARLNDIFRS